MRGHMLWKGYQGHHGGWLFSCTWEQEAFAGAGMGCEE